MALFSHPPRIQRLLRTRLQISVGYATYWDTVMPDPTLLTHINYLFAKIKSDFESLDIRTPSCLEKIVALKQSKPDLKVLLAVGGWGAGNFSEMAADENHRKKFCENCLAAIHQYGLDGIDLDWEYPTSSSADNDRKSFLDFSVSYPKVRPAT